VVASAPNHFFTQIDFGTVQVDTLADIHRLRDIEVHGKRVERVGLVAVHGHHLLTVVEERASGRPSAAWSETGKMAAKNNALKYGLSSSQVVIERIDGEGGNDLPRCTNQW
jgi:hypothetical protein